jgi:hypothetical protein
VNNKTKGSKQDSQNQLRSPMPEGGETFKTIFWCFLVYGNIAHFIFRIRKLRMYRQRNDQNKKNKQINNDLQNTTHSTKDRTTQIPINPEVNSCAPEG